MKLLKRLAPYSFVFTILWFGFVLSLAFVETPLRFQPDRISTDEALSIGHLVFHALNAAEIVFAFTIVVSFLVDRNRSARLKIVLVVLVGMLTIQTWMLFTVLDSRVASILQGQEVPPAMYHTAYIAMDVLKLGLLGWLAAMQIHRFEKRQ